MAGISMALLALVVIGTLAEAMIQHMSERVGRIEKVGPKSKHVSASALPPSPSSSFPSSSLPSSSSSSSYLPPVVLTRVCAPYYGPSDAEGDHSPGYTARPGKQHTLSTQARKTNSARDLTLESGEGSDAAQPSLAVRMLICFSVIRNLRSLFAARKASVIKCLDGIRVLSICYVIMGHTLVTSLSVSGSSVCLPFI